MGNLNLKIVCEPLFRDKYLLEEGFSEKDLVGSGFFRKEIRTCIPLGTLAACHDKDDNALKLISHYIEEKPPHFTSVRVTDLEGDEPAYIRVSPTLEKADENIWKHVYHLWPGLLEQLISQDNTCYLSSWLLVQEYLPEALPSDFDGKIIPRGSDPEVPVLLECTASLISLAKTENRAGLMDRHIWDYGTWGYILPKSDERKIEEWASASECTKQMVTDFFETVLCVFWVKYELEGIWVMSHKMRHQDIYSILDVDKVNADLLSGKIEER
jgi:hypothetical protein